MVRSSSWRGVRKHFRQHCHAYHTVMVPWFLLLSPLGASGVVHACRQACAQHHRLFVAVRSLVLAPRRWAMTDFRVSARALTRER